MSQRPFDESASWSLDVPKAETYVGSIFYQESGRTTEFHWEMCGGSPYAIVYPSDLGALVPCYVLQRVSDGFRTKILTCESRAEFPSAKPNVIHIYVAPSQSKDAQQ